MPNLHNIKHFLCHIINDTFPSSENAFYDAILQREHHLYNNVSRGATLVNEIYKNAYIYQHRIIISLGHTYSAGEILGNNERVERIIAPQHD